MRQLSTNNAGLKIDPKILLYIRSIKCSEFFEHEIEKIKKIKNYSLEHMRSMIGDRPDT